MNNDKMSLKPLRRGSSQTSNSDMQALRQQLQQMNKVVQNQQNELKIMGLKCKQQGLRNQKLKKQAQDAQVHIQNFIQKQVDLFFVKYKDTDSPLFNNENGLSPFELLKLGDSKFQGQQNSICMVCFMDLQKGSKILNLPCSHTLHKECGIQNLLYSKVCPACNTSLK